MASRAYTTQCACTNLRRAAQAITQVYDEALLPIGLRVTQYSVLRAITMAGTAKITELAEWLSLDRTTLTRNLKLLGKEGLIQVMPGADRRVRAVSLTIEGRNAFQKAVPLWEQGQTKVKRYLGAPRMESLLSTLSEIQALGR